MFFPCYQDLLCILGHAYAKLGNLYAMMFFLRHAFFGVKYIRHAFLTSESRFLVYLEYAFYFLVTGEICTKY